MIRVSLILFGPPGSGKGTQAKLLRQHWNWPHISTGDMLRAHVQAQDELGRKIAAIMHSGGLVSDELVNELVERRIAQPDCEVGFILDGYPRTIPQALILEDMLDRKGFRPVVVYLKVDYNKVIARLSGRRLCPQCGSLYSLPSNAPEILQVCDYDGAALMVREDDRPEVIRQRLEAYEHQTFPVIDHFRQVGVTLFEVDGTSGSPQAIARRITALVDGVVASAEPASSEPVPAIGTE